MSNFSFDNRVGSQGGFRDSGSGRFISQSSAQNRSGGQLAHIEIIGDDVFIAWLDKLAREIAPWMQGALKKVGELWKTDSAQLTKEEGHIGATKAYLTGFNYDLTGAHTSQLVGLQFFNTAPHSYYVEHGRRPGALPPSTPIQAWMKAKGIDPKAEFPIRRAIAQLGTIRRYGARGDKAGAKIIETVTKETQDEVLGILDDWFERILMHRN